MQYGFGLTTLQRCHSAVLLCLAFYVGSKMIIYMFLIERAHAIRVSRLTRFEDTWWLLSMLCLLCGFGTIAILAFIDPMYEMSEENGRCKLGLPFQLTVSLLVYDTAMNLGMTLLFLVLLKPYLHGEVAPSWVHRFVLSRVRRVFRRTSTPDPPLVIHRSNDKRVLERLAYKSFWASFTILLGTVANMTVLFKLQGLEEGWICFTTCTVDVVWGVLVIHFITSQPEDVDTPSNQGPLIIPDGPIRLQPL
ncbi:MAG: hypothetical protein M1837_001699 [Sclerophora amabilis]|nr:MAG: hypothetical protein M1837_001699 [Sclerophora amabilis]